MRSQDEIRRLVEALPPEKRALLGRRLAISERSEGGEKELVAYLVVRPEEQPGIEELRGFLARTLPDYMIPAAFVTLPALPRTISGKLDRSALPPPGSSRPALKETYVAPRTPLERELERIWSEVLELEQVGVYDNFFDLGGDSILCLRLAARARSAGLSLLPRQVYEYQTIDELARRLAAPPQEP